VEKHFSSVCCWETSRDRARTWRNMLVAMMTHRSRERVEVGRNESSQDMIMYPQPVGCVRIDSQAMSIIFGEFTI
jgi:hypothetical protein